MKGVGTTTASGWEGGRTPLRRVVLYSFVTLVFGFLVLPSFVVIPLSVTDSIYLHFPPTGFTWRWYQDYFGVEGASHFGSTGRWIPATIISLELALLTVALAVPIGAMAAYGLSRGNYKGKAILNAVIISPLIMPVLITAIAFFFFFSRNLRPFFYPLPLPTLPVWGEWIVIVVALILCVAACGILVLPRVFKLPPEGTLSHVLYRGRPWAAGALAATGSFFLIAWAAGAADNLPGGVFAANDPIPPIPMVSPGLVVAHVILAIPYVVIILTATLRGVDETMDHAAAMLGAGPFTAFRRVVLPCMSTGLASAAFFCFIVSWDEPVIALFLSTSDVSTLPKEIWDGIRTEVSPTIAAIASMLIFLTITLLSIGYMVRKWAKRARE